jgi:hypothetical protein
MESAAKPLHTLWPENDKRYAGMEIGFALFSTLQSRYSAQIINFEEYMRKSAQKSKCPNKEG